MLQFRGARTSSIRRWGNQSGAFQSVIHPVISAIAGKQFPFKNGGKTLTMYNNSQEARVLKQKYGTHTPNNKGRQQELGKNAGYK